MADITEELKMEKDEVSFKNEFLPASTEEDACAVYVPGDYSCTVDVPGDYSCTVDVPRDYSCTVDVPGDEVKSKSTKI